MDKHIKVDNLPEFDAASFLDSEETIAAYLTDVLAEEDSALFAAAVGDIARARGMTEIAKSAGLAREALYRALRAESTPRFDTLSRVCRALGVRLVAQPISYEGVKHARGEFKPVQEKVERVAASESKAPKRGAVRRFAV